MRYYPQRREFDHFYGHINGFLNYDLHTIWRGVDWQRNGQTVYEDGYSTHLIAEEAVRLIKTRDDSAPMFLYVSFSAPHSPLQAPDSALAPYMDIEDVNRRVYAAMVSEMDRGIGQVLATLEAEGIDDETLVLFMSDNGGAESLGANNGELRGGKGTTWEGGIRVPAVLWWPDGLDAGSSHDEIIAVEDLLPTLLSALNVAQNFLHPLDGVDLWLDIAEQHQSEGRVRILARHWAGQHSFGILQDEWKLVQMPNEASGEPDTQLFQIDEDQYERRDLAAEHPDVVARLLSTLREIPPAPIAALDDAPLPTVTGLGGPASPAPDNRSVNREPYAESTRGQ